MPLPQVDVVISSSYGYAHGFRGPGDAVRLCYCHGPLRHLWSQADAYADSLPAGLLGRLAFTIYSRRARRADLAAADGIDAFLTQSPFTAALIQNVYGRHAEVLPPPVDMASFVPSPDGIDDYFLFAGRLVEPYKRPTVVIDAFRDMPDKRLLVAGDGPQKKMLMERATPNVEFLGMLGDDALVRTMQRCQATIFPSLDDYGLVPLEVNACGRPVIALPAGGSLYTVRGGVSGEFLADGSREAIVSAVRGFESRRFDSASIREHALQHSIERFRETLDQVVRRSLSRRERVSPSKHPHAFEDTASGWSVDLLAATREFR